MVYVGKLEWRLLCQHKALEARRGQAVPAPGKPPARKPQLTGKSETLPDHVSLQALWHLRLTVHHVHGERTGWQRCMAAYTLLVIITG